MGVTIAAALKKIAIMLITDKRVRKVTGGILLGIFVILIMPVAALVAIFNGNVKIDTDRFAELVLENLSEGDRENLDLVDETLAKLKGKMEENNFGSRCGEAEALYLLGLVEYSSEENFCDKLAGCFEEDQTDKELVDAVNETFGTDIAAEDFGKIMERYRS